jgi:hypothetical protein
LDRPYRGAAEQRARTESDEHEGSGEDEQHEIPTGPRDPETFAGPEHAECGKHDSDTKFERVFRNPCKRSLDEDAEGENKHTGGERPQLVNASTASTSDAAKAAPTAGVATVQEIIPHPSKPIRDVAVDVVCARAYRF